MEINPKLAQYIIDYTSHIVNYTINIMNPDAIIIASTDSKRIGEHHMGAKKVMITHMPYKMSEQEASIYPNVLPGISFPIYFKDEIIGVIGVGATGSEAETIGKFLQSTTMLLIEQSDLKESLDAETQVLNEFLTNLLSESWYTNEIYFNHQIKLHRLSVNQPYYVVTAELMMNAFETGSKNSYDSDIVHYEKNITRLLESIRYKLNYDKLLTVYIPNSITFLVPCDVNDINNKEGFENDFISGLDFVLSQILNSEYTIGIGGFAKDMTKIHNCYKHAISAIKLSKVTNPDKRITSFNDVYLEYMILNVPQNKREHYYKTILGPLINSDEEPGMWINTLEAYFENDQSITKTSAQLYIHRNTLLFRLNKIAKLTGFNPQTIKGAANLYVALTLWKLDINANQEESL